jgi:hypothetical protein
MNFNDIGTLPSALWSRVLTFVWLDEEIVITNARINREKFMKQWAVGLFVKSSQG